MFKFETTDDNVMEQEIWANAHETRERLDYSSSCSQIVLVSLQPFRRNSLLKCEPQPKIAKIKKKTLILGVQRLLKSSMLIWLKARHYCL